MLTITKTYTDYDGNERTEDFRFNLSKAEVIEMETTTEGGLTAMLEKIVKASDTPEIVKVFKKILLKSYGEKSSDGRRFVKSKEISDAFSQTEAYSMIFTELTTDEEKAAAFINAVIPNMDDEVKEDKSDKQTATIKEFPQPQNNQ